MSVCWGSRLCLGTWAWSLLFPATETRGSSIFAALVLDLWTYYRWSIFKSGKDGHVCWNSNCRLPLIVCWQLKTDFRFPFPFAVNRRNWLFSFPVCSIQTEVSAFYCSVFFINSIFSSIFCIYIYAVVFAHRANGSLSFVLLLTKKQTEVICLQAD